MGTRQGSPSQFGLDIWPWSQNIDTVVNRALPSLHEVSLEITLTVPLIIFAKESNQVKKFIFLDTQF